MTTENECGEDVEKSGDPRALWVGTQNGAASEESSVTVPQKIKHGVDLGIQQSEHILKRMESRGRECVCTSVHSSSNMEAAQCSQQVGGQA